MVSGGTPGGVRAHPSGIVEQGLSLLGAEALDPAVVGDADVLHDPAGLDLADAREGLEQREDLQLADVGVIGSQGLGQRQRVVLQLRP